MFNFNGGTVIPGLTLPVSTLTAAFFFHGTCHLAVILGLLFLSFISLFFLAATLSRFFFNLKKCYSGFNYPEEFPYSK